MANDFVFTEEEMAVDEGLGYPKAFAKLCRDRSFGPFSHGPPYTFTPYALVQQEEERAQELDELFPLIDPKAKPTTKPKIFLSLLWKQLNHLGNAGFDPEIIRVDPYGNVLYYHADAASPLAWEIDHWFPCSRGGLTVPSNLRILQLQVSRRKHNKLEFLIPWWDLQVGISINQFLSIFASSNSDFRRRAFSWLFYEGESEELNATQTVDSHTFPQHFLESEGRLGLAPAAVVLNRRESSDAPLKSLDLNRRPRSNTPVVAAVKKGNLASKDDQNALMMTNPYQAIVMARDSLKQREESAKMQAEIQKLDNEVCELQQKPEEDKLSIQELELVLIKKRRRAEKCRRLAESQSSYRTMLEKMIRDAMHQSVVYKEQVRLNQAAASALLARLEAQKAICDSAERELHMKFRQRDELEKQIRPEWEQARKRSRMDDTLNEERDDQITLCLPGNEPKTQQEIEEDLCTKTAKSSGVLCLSDIDYSSQSHKELRKFLEEEQTASSVSPLKNDEREEEETEGDKETTKIRILKPDLEEDEYIVEERLEKLEIQDGGKIYDIQFPFPHEPEEEEDEETRRQRGKGNIEKWMQFLLEHTHDDADEKVTSRTDELIEKMNMVYPHRDTKDSEPQNPQCKETAKAVEERKMDAQPAVLNERNEKAEEIVLTKTRKSISYGDKENDKNMANVNTPFKNPPYRITPQKATTKELVAEGKGARRLSSPDVKVRREKIGKEKELVRSESARAFRRIPSSPSLILEGVKKRVDCIGRRPSVHDDDDGDQSLAARNSFIKSSIKTIKKAVRI